MIGLDRDQIRIKDQMAVARTQFCDNIYWFHPCIEDSIRNPVVLTLQLLATNSPSAVLYLCLRLHNYLHSLQLKSWATSDEILCLFRLPDTTHANVRGNCQIWIVAFTDVDSNEL